jgi:hypothetical protein
VAASWRVSGDAGRRFWRLAPSIIRSIMKKAGWTFGKSADLTMYRQF